MWTKGFKIFIIASGVFIILGIAIVIRLLTPAPDTVSQNSSYSTPSTATPYHGNYFGPSETPDSRDTIDLSSGKYIAGEDFAAGKYDIVAISGTGSVFSDDFEISAMMGAEAALDSETSKYYETEYQNITLTDGVELSVNGLTIRLIPS